MALGLYMIQHATALWQIWVVYGTIFPFSSALMGPLASQTLIAKWFVTQRGLAMGLSAMGTNVGGGVFPLVVSGLLVDVGWRDTLAFLAVGCFLLVVPLTWVVLRRSPPVMEIPTGSGEATVDHREWTTREILTTSLFWLPFLSLVLINMSFGALQFNLGGFARDVGASDESTAILITVSAVGMVMGKLFCGGMGDRLDHRIIFWLANLLMIVALGLMLVADSYADLLMATLCMGLAGGGILPMMGVIFSARFGAALFGRVMGFVMLNIMFGALSPMLAGWIFDATGSYEIAFWALLVVTLPAMVAMVKLPQPARLQA